MESTAEEISLRDILMTLWSRRLMIVLLTVVMTAAGMATALLLPEKYDSSVVLSPTDDDSGKGGLGSASSLLSQVSGLASIGGFSIGGSGGRKAESIATLTSAALTEEFIRDNNLLPVLYASKWDPKKNTWESDDPDDVPTLWKAERKFKEKIRSISEDKKSGLVTLVITWKDPKQAAAWATDLVARANRTLRQHAIEQSQRNLDYLSQQLTKTSVVELQKSIYSLIENEIKQVMVANGNEEYAFRVIDPARVAEERSSPKRVLITLAGLFVGLILGVVLALVLPARRS